MQPSSLVQEAFVRLRRALRSRGHHAQALDRGHADPGAARCDGSLVEATAHRSGPGATDSRALGSGVRRRQQRAAGHQHPVRHGADADRQGRDVSVHPRQAAHAGSGRSSVSGPWCSSSSCGRGGGPRPPLLEIALADGARLVQDAGPVLGTAENPMTRDQFVAKCRDLMAPVLGAAPSMRLIDRVLELERAKRHPRTAALVAADLSRRSAETLGLSRDEMRVGAGTLPTCPTGSTGPSCPARRPARPAQPARTRPTCPTCQTCQTCPIFLC